MKFLERFVSEKQQQKLNKIGVVRIDSESDLSHKFIEMFLSMKMNNPISIISQSDKGVKITKDNNCYLITLYMFESTKKITWSSNFPVLELAKMLEDALRNKIIISFLNRTDLKDGKSLVQLGYTN